MTSEDLSQQTNASTVVDPSQTASTPVTAAVTPADNATPSSTPTPIADPQQAAAGRTGEGGDEPLGQTNDFRDYAAQRDAFLRNPAPDPAPTPPPAEPVTPAAPAATPATPPVAAPLNDEDDFPSAPVPGQKIPAIKIKPVTPVDVQAMAAFKAAQRAGETMSFIEYVQTHYPATPAAAATAEPGTAPPSEPVTPAAPQTVNDVDAQLKQLKEDRYKAMEDFDFKKAREIEDQEEALRAQRETLLVTQQQTQSEAERAWNAEELAYLEKTAAMFPQSVRAEDPLNVKAQEIYQGWCDSRDPRASMPAGQFYAFSEAALHLGIQPTAAPAAPVSQTTSPPPPVNRPPASAIIASGNASTTTTRSQPDTRSYAEQKADFLKGDFGRRSAA